MPVLSERFLAKAHERGADAIILDLEDSILPTRKADARAALPAAVPRVAQKGAAVVVRINRPIDLAVADIAASVMPGVAGLMLPKVMGPSMSGCSPSWSRTVNWPSACRSVTHASSP